MEQVSLVACLKSDISGRFVWLAKNTSVGTANLNSILYCTGISFFLLP